MNFRTSLKLLPVVVTTLNLMTAAAMPSSAAQDLTNRSEASISQVITDQSRTDTLNLLESEATTPFASTANQAPISSDLMSELLATTNDETDIDTVNSTSDSTVASQSENHTFTIKNTEEIVELDEPSFTVGGLTIFLLGAPLVLAVTKPKRSSST